MLTVLRLTVFGPLAACGLQTFARSEEKGSNTRDAVWIISQMRSGSTTVLSMISATLEDNTEGEQVFSLFEPCHQGDEFATLGDSVTVSKDPVLCGSLIHDLAKCDFSEVKDLDGWRNHHSSNNGTKEFSRELAEAMCKKSEMVALKTVQPMFIKNVSSVLTTNPHLKIIEVIRDPRGIYASHQNLHGNHFSIENMNNSCNFYAENLKFKHERIHRVVFDQLVADPLTVSKGVYKFLKMPWGSQQNEWVKATFNAQDCEGSKVGSFHDCHSDSAAVATLWKNQIGTDVEAAFADNKDCIEVAKAYKLAA